MNKRLRKKAALLAAAVAIFSVLAGGLLMQRQTSLSNASCDEEFERVSSELPGLLEAADEETAENTRTFDAQYQSRAAAISYMAAHDAGFAPTDACMADLKDLLKVEGVFLVRRDGSVVAASGDSKADFSAARFNLLRRTLDDGEPSGAVEVELPDRGWFSRYYASRVGQDLMAVLEVDPSSLRSLTDNTGSAASVLSGITLGQHGYAFAVSAKNNLVTYHPNADLVGTDALDDGLEVADLEDGSRFRATVAGEDLYCAVKKVGDSYCVLAIPESETAASRGITVGVVLFVFVATLAAIALYGVFALGDDAASEHAEGDYRAVGSLRLNRPLARKAVALSAVGVAVLLCVTWYMQTLFSLSEQSVLNRERASQVAQTLEESDARKEELTSEYSERYLTMAHVAGRILEANPSLANRADLRELAQTLQVETIYLYDGDGVMTASSTSQRSYALSTTYGDSSYEFRSLLGGKDEYVQEPAENKTTGEVQQYIGVATYDADGIADGLVQISLRPRRLETVLKSVKIDRVLDGIKAGADGFAFAVSKADGTVAYHPNAKLVGKDATSLGLAESQMEDGFCDFVDLGGEKLYAACAEQGDYYLYVATPESALTSGRAQITLLTGAVALACLAFVYVVISFERPSCDEAAGDGAVAAGGSPDGPRPPASARAADPDGRVIDVTLADGRVKRSQSAVSRWLDSSFSWTTKTPEGKLGFVLRCFMGVAVVCVCVAVVFKDRLFDSSSVFSYILGDEWVHGLNIFAVTAAAMYACVAVTASELALALLRLVSNALGAQGETVCRLLASVVKYGTVIFMLYWCLGVVGVDTATLLASAGIITLAVSFGAKDLVTDVLCGLFIIFEGEFRVGDVIQVGGNTGTVMEIGVRTTKVNDGNGNVLVLRNSGISNVVNKTKMNSFASVDVTFPVGESLPYVENVLHEELPRVKERVPEILDGPFYKGVVDLSESSVTIRVVAACSEQDRGALERGLKREMKLLLSRRNVTPYQLTFDHATEEELEQADTFTEEQAEASRGLDE